MSTRPLILLPPSEGKTEGGSGPAWRAGSLSFPELDDRRNEVLDALATAMKGSEAARAKLLGVKGTALAEETATNRAVRTSPTRAAIERYDGVLYDALDVRSLSRRDRSRLDSSVVIFSGLWGMVRPDDPIPDYKLKMGASLAPIGKLSAAWRTGVTAALAPIARRRVVWNLLPKEHGAAWTPIPADTNGAPSAILSVRFLDEKPGKARAERQFTVVNHWNKLLKGALVRHILATGADEPEALASFEHPQGYVYDPSLTTTEGDRIVVAMVRPPA